MIPLLLKVGQVEVNPTGTIREAFVNYLLNVNSGSIRPTVEDEELRGKHLKFSNVNDGSNINLFSRNNNESIRLITAFLASTSLAVAGHSTTILDFMGKTIGNIVRYIFDALSLTLGTATLANYLAGSKDSSESDFDVPNIVI